MQIMTELETLSQVADLGTAIATIVLVIIIWKTVAQLEETVKVSRIQITHRFRPWIGHQNKIELMSTDQDRHQFAITLRNYGEIPSSNLLASFISKTEPIPKELAKKSNSNTFNLGPLLPNMEKRYWFFVDSDLIQTNEYFSFLRIFQQPLIENKVPCELKSVVIWNFEAKQTARIDSL